MSDEERKLRSARAREMVSLPFLLLPRTPSSSLPSLPCADAQGWKATSLDNARKFRMKFTVADPSFSGDIAFQKKRSASDLEGRRATQNKKAGDVLLSPLRGLFAAPNRPWYSLLIPKLQLPLQPFLNRGRLAAPRPWGRK